MHTSQLCWVKIFRAAVVLFLLFSCQIAFTQDFHFNRTKYEKDTSRFASAKSLYDKARNALNQGNTQVAIDNYVASIEEYKSIYESALKNGNYDLATSALLEKADVERRIYRDDTPYNTLNLTQELLKQHIPVGNFLWFRTYLSFGRLAHTRSDYYNATDYLDSAQILYNKSNQYDSADFRNLLEYKFYGYLYSNQSIDTVQKYIDTRLALENLEQEKKPDPYDLIYLLEDYPDIFSLKGEYDIALAYAINNYKYYNQNKEEINSNERYGEVYFDLSLALLRKDQLDRALEIANEYLNSDKTKQSIEQYATMISLVGTIYNELGEFEKSISYFERFLDIDISGIDERTLQNHKIARATALLNMGINLYQLGNTEKAIENYDRSLKEMKSIVEFPSTALINCYRYIGDFYVIENHWDNALISFDSALRNTELKYEGPVLEFPNTDSTSRFSLEALTILKKKSKAIFQNYQENPKRYLESVINHVDQTHERIRGNRDDLYKSDGKLFLSQFFKDLYETGIEASYQLFQITGDKQYAWKAFQYAQMSKSNLFLEQEKDYKEFTSSDIPYSLKEEYYTSTGRLDNLKAMLLNALDNSVTGDSVLRLSDQIIELEDKTTFLRDSISQNYGGAVVSDHQNTIIENLDSKSLLVEYFYGVENVYAFAINYEQEIIFEKTPNNEELKSSLEGFLNIVALPPDYEKFDSDLANYRVYAQSLYKLLLEPVLNDLKGSPKELVIVPDEFLTRVPFEAFLMKDGEGKTYRNFDYLINSFNVRYLISSNVQKGAKEPISNDYRILGIGFSEAQNMNPDNGRGYASLPGTEREIQFLQASFAGDYYLGENGSRKKFLSDARNYDIIHLAVHGKADSTNRVSSSLIFNGSDSILNTNQLYLANIQAQLTVLSACESGKGQIESGEGTFSIARGFAIVGVPNVVMSLWEVNDKTTSSQMVEFYDNFLNKRYDLNSSLRQVKLDYIEAGDSYLSHPYFWASFIHLGQNTSFERSFLERNMLFLIVLLTVGLLSGGIFVVNKKRKGIQ